jgi:predicted membrane protein
MLQFLRVVALIVLILITLVDFKFVSFMVQREWLYILSTFILLTILFVDVITGFILALAMITLIVKLYKIQLPWGYSKQNDTKLLDYITPEHLRSAQDNVIIDEEGYKKEWKGIQGVYGEEVYGAQGLEIFPGYVDTPTDKMVSGDYNYNPEASS